MKNIESQGIDSKVDSNGNTTTDTILAEKSKIVINNSK